MNGGDDDSQRVGLEEQRESDEEGEVANDYRVGHLENLDESQIQFVMMATTHGFERQPAISGGGSDTRFS